MLSLPDDWNYSIAGLVKLSKDGKDSVMSALSELEKYGYLLRVKTTNSKGQFSGIEYNIYEEPQSEKPIADNPIAYNENEEKQKAANPNADEPPQLNTNELTTNELNTKGNKDTKETNTKPVEIDLEPFNDSLKNIVNESLKKLYIDYIEMRASIDAPMTKRGFDMLVQRCERLSNCNIRVQKLLLETAIINNWKNVYLPSEEEIKGAHKEVLDELKNFYSLD